MSQAPPLIGPNKSGLTYRQEDNEGKQALLTHHKGPSAPPYVEAGTIWLDDVSTPWLLKVYDGADWICLSQINAMANTVLPYAGQSVMRGLHLSADTGYTDNYATALIPALSSYVAGLVVFLRVASTNSGACTLSVDGLSSVAIKMLDGADVVPNAMRADGLYLLCYDGTFFKLLNPSQLHIPAIVQTKTAFYSGSAVLTTTIPADDTLPSSTEGSEIMSVSITPSAISSRMVIRVTGMCASVSATSITGALLVHGEPAAFAAASTYSSTANQPCCFSLTSEHMPGSTAPITYKLRIGAATGNVRPNGSGSTRLFAGNAKWIMTVEEHS